MTHDLPDEYAALLDESIAVNGHFQYESGHHGDLWLHLDRLFVNSRRTKEWSQSLAAIAKECAPMIVCGPMSGGAFVALFVAAFLDAQFVYAQQARKPGATVTYSLPPDQEAYVCDARVLVVDDVVNAGSALLETCSELHRCGAEVVGTASLAVLSDADESLRRSLNVPFYKLVRLDRRIWDPDDCKCVLRA